MLTIIRTYLMYRPLYFFMIIGGLCSIVGVGVFFRFFVYYLTGNGNGHIQSLIFASMMIVIGFQTIVVGLLGDVISANRKILQDVQYHMRKMNYDMESMKTPVYETSDLKTKSNIKYTMQNLVSPNGKEAGKQEPKQTNGNESERNCVQS